MAPPINEEELFQAASIAQFPGKTGEKTPAPNEAARPKEPIKHLKAQKKVRPNRTGDVTDFDPLTLTSELTSTLRQLGLVSVQFGTGKIVVYCVQCP